MSHIKKISWEQLETAAGEANLSPEHMDSTALYVYRTRGPLSSTARLAHYRLVLWCWAKIKLRGSKR